MAKQRLESPRRKMKPVFLVFCEGETEETYLASETGLSFAYQDNSQGGRRRYFATPYRCQKEGTENIEE